MLTRPGIKYPQEMQAAEPTGSAPFPGTKQNYHGYERYDFVVDGQPSLVVVPKRIAPGKPWIWRAEFFDHHPEIDLGLVEQGYHLAYMNVGNTFGCPDAMRHFDEFYKLLTEKHGFSRKPVLEGLSRGGLYVYNWGAAHPDQVGLILGDNPVCDFKSWPGGKGKGPGSPGDWAKLIMDYKFKDEAEALAYAKNPIDQLEPLAKAKVPLLHICGDADEVVPFPENSVLIQQRYEKLGGKIHMIIKPGLKHHPHGLEDPAPAVKFILENALPEAK